MYDSVNEERKKKKKVGMRSRGFRKKDSRHESFFFWRPFPPFFCPEWPRFEVGRSLFFCALAGRAQACDQPSPSTAGSRRDRRGRKLCRLGCGVTLPMKRRAFFSAGCRATPSRRRNPLARPRSRRTPIVAITTPSTTDSIRTGRLGARQTTRRLRPRPRGSRRRQRTLFGRAIVVERASWRGVHGNAARRVPNIARFTNTHVPILPCDARAGFTLRVF